MTTRHKLWIITALTAAFGLGYLAARPSSAPVNVVTGLEARQAVYVASESREPFHLPTCRWAKKISERNMIGYKSRTDAVADGHRPCKVCRP